MKFRWKLQQKSPILRLLSTIYMHLVSLQIMMILDLLLTVKFQLIWSSVKVPFAMILDIPRRNKPSAHFNHYFIYKCILFINYKQLFLLNKRSFLNSFAFWFIAWFFAHLSRTEMIAIAFLKMYIYNMNISILIFYFEQFRVIYRFICNDWLINYDYKFETMLHSNSCYIRL